MSHTPLPGIAARPLSGYLSALGILRALATQGATGVTGWWDVDTFCIGGTDRAAIIDFFDHRFRPAPIFSPWNKEGDPARNASTRSTLANIAGADTQRLDAYRQVLAAFEALQRTCDWPSMSKAEQLVSWRATVPDEGLPWLDAVVVLGATDDPSFLPLLGSGGNDGRLEFSRLLHREIDRLFINEKSAKHRRRWFESLCFAEPGAPLVQETLGMYDGDATGTANSSPTGSAPSAVNPWSIVLTFEGLLAFGGSAASRLGFGRAHAMSSPFMVRSSHLGSSGAVDEDSKGELWAPIWPSPASWPEVRRFISEGRLEWNGAQARTSVDATRAVANLGTERGVASFERFDIVKRNGLSYVASPLGRTVVRRIRGVDLLEPIDDWAGRVRRGAAGSVSVAAALRHLDAALSSVVEDGGSASAFLQVLTSLAALERAVGRSSAVRDSVGPFPARHRGVPVLSAEAWTRLLIGLVAPTQLDELAVAIGLAGLEDPASHRRSPTSSELPYQHMSAAIRGLRREGNGLRWANTDEGRDIEASAAGAARDAVAVEVLARRLRGTAPVSMGTDADEAVGRVAYTRGPFVALERVNRLLSGELDIANVMRLVRGLAMLDGWPDVQAAEPTRPAAGSGPDSSFADPWFTAVRLCLLAHHEADLDLLGRASGLPGPVAPPAPDRSWGRLISAGRLAEVGAAAATRLRRVGFAAPASPIPPARIKPNTIAVALQLRLSRSALRSLAATFRPRGAGDQPS